MHLLHQLRLVVLGSTIVCTGIWSLHPATWSLALADLVLGGGVVGILFALEGAARLARVAR